MLLMFIPATRREAACSLNWRRIAQDQFRFSTACPLVVHYSLYHVS
jgi:hypothetical protein